MLLNVDRPTVTNRAGAATR